MKTKKKYDDSRAAEAEAKLKAMGVEFHEGFPVFPFVPDSVKESKFHVFEPRDFPTDADVQELARLMWLEPESDFYYYHEQGAADAAIIAAHQNGDVLMNEYERRYYKHPRYLRDYVRIVPKGENEYNWDWEREVVEKGPEFWRVTPKLSKRKLDELDAWRKVQLEEHFREQSRKARAEQIGVTDQPPRDPSEWDPMVGMLRKEVFEREIASKATSAIETNESLGLLFIDVDDFKNVNTDHGHPVGDKVLRSVSEKVRKVVGNRGDCYRNGGEEFCVLLHNHTSVEAALLADRVRREISTEPISDEALSITVSIGVAAVPCHAQTSDELLKQANDAMRKAKELGKDRVVTMDDEETTFESSNSTRLRKPELKVLTAPRPDVRISISMAVTAGTAIIPSTVVSVRIENHSPVSVHITSAYFSTDDDQAVLIPKDVLGQSLLTEQELKAGKAVTYLIDPTHIKKFLHLGVNNIWVRDAIGREYSGDEESVKQTLQALQ